MEGVIEKKMETKKFAQASQRYRQYMILDFNCVTMFMQGSVDSVKDI